MMPSCDHTGVPGLVGLTHFHSSTTSGSAFLMSARILLRVFPRQSPSSANLFEMSSDADWSWLAPDFFMFPSFIAAAGPRGQALAGVACTRRQEIQKPTTITLERAVLRSVGFCRVNSMGSSSLDSTLRGVGRPTGGLDAELLCVLGVQSLPATELHRVGTNDAADGGSAEKVIQNIEANVPPGSTHRDEAAIDVGPQCQARAGTKGLELPPHIEATPVVLEHLGSVGSRHLGFGHVRRGRSHRGELHRASNRPQAPIGVEGRPLAELRRIGERLPDFLRRLAQFPDENERPLLSVLSYLRPAGRTRRVLFASDHLLLLVFFFVRVDRSMRSRWRSRASTRPDQNRRNGASQASTS